MTFRRGGGVQGAVCLYVRRPLYLLLYVALPGGITSPRIRVSRSRPPIKALCTRAR